MVAAMGMTRRGRSSHDPQQSATDSSARSCMVCMVPNTVGKLVPKTRAIEVTRRDLNAPRYGDQGYCHPSWGSHTSTDPGTHGHGRRVLLGSLAGRGTGGGFYVAVV